MCSRSPIRHGPDELAGTTYNGTEEQYEETVEAGIRAFEVTRRLPAYERGASGTGSGLILAVTPATPDGAGTSTIDADNGAAVMRGRALRARSGRPTAGSRSGT